MIITPVNTDGAPIYVGRGADSVFIYASNLIPCADGDVFDVWFKTDVAQTVTNDFAQMVWEKALY